MTLAQIKALRLRNEHGGQKAALTSERGLTLVEVLRAEDGQIVLNLDIKDPIYVETASKVRRLGAVERVSIKAAAADASV